MTQFEVRCCKVCLFLRVVDLPGTFVWCAERWELEGKLEKLPNGSKGGVTMIRVHASLCCVSFHALVKADQNILCSSLPLVGWLGLDLTDLTGGIYIADFE